MDEVIQNLLDRGFSLEEAKKWLESPKEYWCGLTPIDAFTLHGKEFLLDHIMFLMEGEMS